MFKYLFLVILVSCSSDSDRFNPRFDQVTNDKCCADRRPNGVCKHELVPGCSNSLSPVFRKEFLTADECCEYWGADGMCHKELVSGCAGELLNQWP